MNRKYNLKLDLQFRCNNSTMKFNQFDNNTSDFFIKISNGGKSFDVEKAIVVLAVIKPSGKVSSQFVEIENGLVYADLKPNMRDEIGTYTAQAMLILEDERVVTDVISYEVEEDKIFSLLNDTVETTEEFTLLTDMLSRLSTVEISEEQRVINEAERILSEENRKIEEAKRVEVELIRQHEEADRTKYDAIRESNENIRKINEETRISSENVRLENEANRIEQEANRVKAEQLRKDNYNLMTEDEERRRSEANAHKEAEVLRVQAETNRVNEEAKRRISEQARVSAENTRVNNENTRKANETTRQTNETHRVEAETQRQNRYNSFIADAEANANDFENYTNTAKAKEEERKANELDRKSQEDRRVSNEVERISNENTRKANEKAREKNETSRQNIFENKADEVDKKIIELNTTKDNFVSSINTKVDTKISELNTTKDNFISSISTKVDTKISELDNAKSDMTTTVSNKVNEVETRFNALTSSQQQDAEVIDARDGETSLKARLDRDVEKANKELDKIKKLEESTVSTVETESDFTTVEATSNGYFEDVKLEGKTLVNHIDFATRFSANNFAISGGVVTLTNNGSWGSVRLPIPATLKTNTKYTIILNVLENTTGAKFYYLDNNVPTSVFKSSVYLSANSKGIITQLVETVDDFSERNIGMRTDSDAGYVKFTYMLLEGDHTQNPPNGYIEGLKSVGQSATTSEDGVDEIVVSSVNGDGNLFDKKNIHLNKFLQTNGDETSVEGWFVSDYIKVADTCYIKGLINVASSNLARICVYTQNKTFKTLLSQPLNTTLNISSFIENGDYIRITEKIEQVDNIVVCKNEISNQIYQSDKKRLLYYNEETQTWEKPILREWDSIEKHADGKYYYHQRSGEVVLNGSENWNNDKNSSTMSPATYRQSIQFDAIDIPSASFNTKTSPNIISDLLPTVTFGDVYSHNHIGISISGTDSIGTHIIINNNFIDVTELKQWLQANNLTVVYQLAEEKVYECTNIDLITYNGETNFIVESGVLSPKTTLKVHSNISNVVSLLQKKVSLLESNVKASQEVQDMMILETDMRMLDIELALMEFIPMTLNLGGSNMLRSATYFNFLKNHIINETYEKEYLENVMNKYLATGRINQDEYNELYKMLYPPVYDIELPIEY